MPVAKSLCGLLAWGCAGHHPSTGDVAGADLVLEVTTHDDGVGIGYGDIYVCTVDDVLSGTLADPSLRLVLLASYKETALFTDDAALELGFQKHKDNEPYATMPLDGFVDEHHTSWRLLYARPLRTR